MSLHNANIVNKKKGLPWQSIDGESLILNAEKHEAHELNETASFIWSQVDGIQTITQIAQLLSKKYSVELNEATEDILITVNNWLELELVECR